MNITPEIVDLIRTYVTDPGLTIQERTNEPEPAIATVREVDVFAHGNRIDAKYSSANYEVNLANYGGLSEVLRRLARNQLPVNDDPAPKGKYKSQLSLQNRKYCYVILKLTSKNWQFSRDKDPFSIGPGSVYFPPLYFEPRKVRDDGSVVTRGDIADDCKIAYFIADGATANDLADSYEDPFNLHLEVVDRDWENNRSPVPIIIDPDVRYPGGSGEDP